jgi:hypothetical protein
VKRILLRAKKDPFETLSARETLARNVIGTNSGNLVFIEAVHKLLSTRDTQIDVQRRLPHPRHADMINASYDAYVVPLANAFRPGFEPYLVNLARLIRRLTIPVVIVGVGAQADVDYDFESLKPVERSVREFVTAVLNRAPDIGVRGEFTLAYLESLGFRDVAVIGCPSMFMYGDQLRVEKPAIALDPDARLAVNASPGVALMRPILASHQARYRNLSVIAQDLETLALLLLGHRPPEDAAELPPGSSELLSQNQVRLFVDPWPWIDYLRDFAFAFGTRIHGNIVALLAGTPASVLVHDSRSLELVRYFQIPHRLVTDTPADIDASDLYDEADYTELNRGHARRFANFAEFLARHGLNHIYEAGQDPEAFERRVADTIFTPAVDATSAGSATWPLDYIDRTLYRLRRGTPRWFRQLRRAHVRLPVGSRD